MSKISSLRRSALAVIIFCLVINVGIVLAAWDKNPAPRIHLADEKIFNANRSGQSGVDGYDGYLRNVQGQKVHSSFMLNSNSCASCHLTHLGQGSQLLFQTSLYNTCTTCHFDPSMNTYNILNGGESGGRFYDGEFNMAGRTGASFHLATGQKKNSDAPGADTATAGWWDQSFNCGSCHAPHGAYSQRHLHVNPNGQAKRYYNIPLNLVDAAASRYRPASYDDKTPWLYYQSGSALAAHGVVVKNGAGESVTDQFFIHLQQGYVEITGSPGPGPYTVTFSQAVFVDIEVVPAGNGQGEETIYRSGTTNFCTACHTGYLGTQGGKTVTNHLTFSHVINEDLYQDYIGPGLIEPDGRLKLEKSRDLQEERLVCLTCHFAHGTDAAMMVDRNFEPMYTDSTNVPENTYLLRFGQQDGVWESCTVCHDAGGFSELEEEPTIESEPEIHEPEPGVELSEPTERELDVIDESNIEPDSQATPNESEPSEPEMKAIIKESETSEPEITTVDESEPVESEETTVDEEETANPPIEESG